MEFQTFAFDYLAKTLEPQLSKITYQDPVGTYREVIRALEEHKPARDEEALEPAHELSLVYRADDNFKIKGRSYLLFRLFAQNLIQWFWAPDGDPFEFRDVHYLKRLFEQLNMQIEEEDLEFDTDVTWSIKAHKGDDAFTIKVATRLWSVKMELLKY